MTTSKTKAPKVSITVAFILALSKVIIGFLINSMAVVASAADSILDIISSGINYLALKKAELPPDEDHPYGHGKFESLATFIQSIIILISGGYIFYRSIIKIIHKETVEDLNVGIYVMLFSLIATSFLVIYLNNMAKKTGSTVIEADALHYKIDIISNLGIIVALVIIKFSGIQIIDPVISIGIAFYIIYSAIKLNLKVTNELLDAELPKEIKDDILNVLREFEEYQLDAHKIRTRAAGDKKFLDMHITLCRKLTLEEAHKIAELIENSLKSKIKNLDVTIHMDPCSVRDCPGPDKCTNRKIRVE